jgi:hypothetical protein
LTNSISEINDEQQIQRDDIITQLKAKLITINMNVMESETPMSLIFLLKLVLSDFTNLEKKLQKINQFLKVALKELIKQEIQKIEA